MAAFPPDLALREVVLALGGPPVLDGATLHLAQGDRLALVGRNGAGKSTLMRLLAGELEPDAGERFKRSGVRVGYLPQDPELAGGMTVFDHVAGGLPPSLDSAPRDHHVEQAIAALGLDGEARLGRLSGGERRRTALARAVVAEPDLLLLDEPTNHLDLPTIEWLEQELAGFKGALVVISHDRTFLANTTRGVAWLDRGRLYRMEKGGIASFPEWSEKLMAVEAVARHKLDRKIAEETRWLREGLTARRKRNQGRVRQLAGLRSQRRDWLRAPGTVNLATGDATRAGDLVLEARSLEKGYPVGDGETRRLIRDFSLKLKRGDRIGVIGRNGAGKTTLIRMLLKLEDPDRGHVRHGVGLEPVYFDQRRESLDPAWTPWRALCPDGGDKVDVQGKPRHVVSYLRDFLFGDAQATQPIASLSGGERNRLLLAKLFASPHNLLVLDEPTNDLDLETLDLLQEALADYNGTVLLVSHDRDFLDRVATGILAFEGDGRIFEYAGGYSDHLVQKAEASEKSVPAQTGRRTIKSVRSASEKPRPKTDRLSYKEVRALELLPADMERLGNEIAGLEQALADPGLYGRDPAAFRKKADALEAARTRLAEMEEQWLQLEMKREELEA